MTEDQFISSLFASEESLTERESTQRECIDIDLNGGVCYFFDGPKVSRERVTSDLLIEDYYYEKHLVLLHKCPANPDMADRGELDQIVFLCATIVLDIQIVCQIVFFHQKGMGFLIQYNDVANNIVWHEHSKMRDDEQVRTKLKELAEKYCK